MNKAILKHYWAVMVYLGLLTIFLVASFLADGFWEMNVLGFNALLFYPFFSIFTSVFSGSLALIAIPALGMLEPVIISGFLLKRQYRVGDLQNLGIRRFFAKTIAIAYLVYVLACLFSMEYGILLAFPSALLIGAITFPLIFIGMSSGADLLGGMILMSCLVFNAFILHEIVRHFLNWKAKKEISNKRPTQAEIEELGQLGRREINNMLPQLESNEDDKQQILTEIEKLERETKLVGDE